MDHFDAGITGVALQSVLDDQGEQQCAKDTSTNNFQGDVD